MTASGVVNTIGIAVDVGLVLDVWPFRILVRVESLANKGENVEPFEMSPRHLLDDLLDCETDGESAHDCCILRNAPSNSRKLKIRIDNTHRRVEGRDNRWIVCLRGIAIVGFMLCEI